ncbi:MAG TPA: fasciclin domain-containing protein [Actinomycetes bacterium]|nr:fasciclin domain-containing protein [Actinomycetes bacterium]
MRLRNAVAVVSTLALGAGAVLATAPAASAAQGNRSLAKVLTSDGNRFDKKAGDFDIATEAVLAVVKAKPGSPVAVLADGKTRVTAFVPTDRAFKALVFDLTGTWFYKERKAFAAAASLGIDTIETVLLYHVVAGKTLTAAKVLEADGASVATAQGGSVTIDVLDPTRGVVRLQDADPDDVDPATIPRLLNLNKGNKQVAHGIDYVLRPVDL